MWKNHIIRLYVILMDKKYFYISTAIAYTSSKPHIGNTYEIILSDSGSPYLQVNTEVNGSAKALIKISKDEQLLQSSDYTSGSSGIILDLKNKKLEAYSGFKLKAYKNGTDFIEFNASTSSSYPLNITNNFKVSWNGTLYATGADISGKINASESFNSFSTGYSSVPL